MAILEDVWNSIKGNANVRVKDPIIGSFVFSWCLCNWDKLANLFLGAGIIDDRIKHMTDSMHYKNFFHDVDLIILPTILTGIYLFILPRLSLWVKNKQNTVLLSQHNQAIELDIKQAKSQKLLNKVKLRSDPEKEFLSQEVAIDLQEERLKSERRNKIKELIEFRTKNTRAELEIKSSQAERLRVELESKKRQEDTEKLNFEKQVAIHRATLASNRFPIIYQLMNMLSNGLQEDGITISFSGLSNVLSAAFGYDNPEAMINDKEFTNVNFQEIKFLYHDASYLASMLERIAEDENGNEDEISGDIIFDHLLITLEKIGIDLLSNDELAEKISEQINEHSYDILNSEELSGPMAETDTIYDEIELDVDSFHFKNGFEVFLSGYASGHHRKEYDINGRDLSINVMAHCIPKIGRFGLSDYKLTISGTPRDYD